MAIIDSCNLEMIRVTAHVCSPKNIGLAILCMDTDIGNGRSLSNPDSIFISTNVLMVIK